MTLCLDSVKREGVETAWTGARSDSSRVDRTEPMVKESVPSGVAGLAGERGLCMDNG